MNRLIVAIRPYVDAKGRVELDPRVERSVAAIFGEAILRETPARAWPGTELIEHVGKAHVIAFDDAVRRRMIAAQQYLSGWKQWSDPPLPEDVCLYREGDDYPVLVSVTNDGDAWLFDDAPDADFVRIAEIPLPADLIPPGPDFIVSV